jgi:uncharacterized pyridoxal phosphate-dependent enzyme
VQLGWDGRGREHQRREDEAELADLAEPDGHLPWPLDACGPRQNVGDEHLRHDEEHEEQGHPTEAGSKRTRIEQGADRHEEEDREEITEGEQAPPCLRGVGALGNGEACDERREGERHAEHHGPDACDGETTGDRDDEEEVGLAAQRAQDPWQHRRHDHGNHYEGGKREQRVANGSRPGADQGEQEGSDRHARHVLEHAPTEQRVLGGSVGAAAPASRDVDDHDARRKRDAEPQQRRDLKADTRHQHHRGSNGGGDDRLGRSREDEPAMLAPEMREVDFDPDLEEQQHHADVSQELELVPVGDVAGRERRDCETDDEIADDRGQAHPSGEPACRGCRQQECTELQDRNGCRHGARVPGGTLDPPGSVGDSEVVDQRGAIYRRIGVEPIVNGSTTMTRLGGSLMPAEVVEAMRQASESFVDVVELQGAVGRRIAELTRNEAAFVSGGAAAGLFLAAVACMARDLEGGVLSLHERRPVPREFVIHRVQRYPHEESIELAGGRLVEIGSKGATSERELREAIGDGTAGILFVAGSPWATGALPLEIVVRLALEHAIPVIVDAAAQLPPPDNLWAFTEAGADLVIFSGGKGLCGPASTGLVLGRSDLVVRIAANASPHERRMGRPMKVGKEDLIGILAAVDWYLAQDHEALARGYEAMVASLVQWGATRSDVDVVRDYPGEAGQPTPRALIQLRGALAKERDRVIAELLASPPRIAVEPAGANGIHVAPETLVPGEELVVADRLGAVLDAVAAMHRAGVSRG